MAKNEVIPCPSFLLAPARVALGKTGHSVEVKVQDLSADVLAHVFAYGLKQVLNDAAASGKTEDEKLALFNKKLEGLYSGALRASRETDPVAREAKRIATDWVSRKTPHKPGTDEFKAAVAKAMGMDAIQSMAQAAVEAAKALDLNIEV